MATNCRPRRPAARATRAGTCARPGPRSRRTGQAHTGSGAFEARAETGEAAVDFAVLRQKEPLAVFAERTLTLAAHVRTSNGGQVALRAVLAAANEQVPFSFRTGTAMASHEGWTRLEVVVAVPTGCDRLLVEVAALLPGADASVFVDDVAVTEAGALAPLAAKLADGSQTALGTGTALAVRSVDTDNPAVLLQVLPDNVPAPLQGCTVPTSACCRTSGRRSPARRVNVASSSKRRVSTACSSCCRPMPPAGC